MMWMECGKLEGVCARAQPSVVAACSEGGKSCLRVVGPMRSCSHPFVCASLCASLCVQDLADWLP